MHCSVWLRCGYFRQVSGLTSAYTNEKSNIAATNVMCGPNESVQAMYVTSALGTMAAATGSGISTLADNIILMRYNEVKKMLAREMVVLKTRGTAHERKVMPFEITERGIAFSAR